LQHVHLAGHNGHAGACLNISVPQRKTTFCLPFIARPIFFNSIELQFAVFKFGLVEQVLFGYGVKFYGDDVSTVEKKGPESWFAIIKEDWVCCDSALRIYV
jgi:hypothetical protein